MSIDPNVLETKPQSKCNFGDPSGIHTYLILSINFSLD